MFIRPDFIVTQQDRIDFILKRKEELIAEGADENKFTFINSIERQAVSDGSTLLEAFRKLYDSEVGKDITEFEIGFYYSDNININHKLDYEKCSFSDILENPKPKLMNEYPNMLDHGRGECPLSYGVCDSYEQLKNYKIKDYYAEELEDANLAEHINPDKTLFEVLSASERKYALFFTKIHQEPGEGGWRWHKWGPYIGKHDIQCEYLADEDLSDIDQKYVVIFHIFEFKDEK